MKEQITRLEDKHKRYIALMAVMNNAVKNMNNSFKDYEKIELTAQDCVDIANALGNEATLLMREIKDKLKISKLEYEDALKFIENFEEKM